MPSLLGWESLERVSLIQRYSELITVGLLFIAGCTGVLAFVYNQRKDTLTEDAQNAAQAAHSNAESDAERRRKADVAAVQAELSAARGETDRKVAEARAEADAKLSALRAATADRTLSIAQEQVFVSALSPYAGQRVDITCVLGDRESTQLATKLVDVFRSAKWDVGGGTGLNQAVFSGNVIGVQVQANDQDARSGQITPSVEAVIDALLRVNLLDKRGAFARPQVSAGHIAIVVGTKPQNP
jgi:hypothetical protein